VDLTRVQVKVKTVEYLNAGEAFTDTFDPEQLTHLSVSFLMD